MELHEVWQEGGQPSTLPPAAWFTSGNHVRITLPSGTFEIFVRVSGSGPWLTLLHAFPTSSWDWAKVAPALERCFRFLCLDFLGFGESEKPRDHQYSIFEQANLVDEVWRKVGVEQTGVVAHDYGATVAQELMARQKEGALSARVLGVVLLNGALYAHLARPLLIQRLLARPILGTLLARATTERVFARSLSSVFSERHPIEEAELHEHWRIVQRRGSSVPIAPSLVRYVQERKRHAARWEAALESGDPPVSFIWGMSDPRSGSRVAEHVRRRMPGAPFQSLIDAGHYPQLEVPASVAEGIGRAFREMRGGPSAERLG